MKIGENGIIVFKMYDLDMTAVDKVIFTFRGIEKLEKDYPSAYVNYADGRFYVGLTQEDTLILSQSRRVKVQAEAQICFTNGSVAKSDTIDFLLNDTLNTNVIPGNAPSDFVNEIEFHYEKGIIIIGGSGLTEQRVREIIQGYHFVTSDALNDYVTLTSLNAKLNEYVTKNGLDDAIATYVDENVDLSQYATKNELGDYAEKTDLDNYATKTELNDYATKTETEEALADKQDKTQFAAMPTASADYVNKIIQYVGNTNASYNNGYFYKCVSDGASTPNFSWVQHNTQAQSEGGSDSTKRKAIITIVADGTEKAIETTGILGLLESENIPLCMAINEYQVGFNNNYYTLDELHALQNRGVEIFMRSCTSGAYTDGMTVDEFRQDSERCKEYALENGFEYKFRVYPQGIRIDDGSHTEESITKATSKMRVLKELGVEMAFNLESTVEMIDSSKKYPIFKDWYTYANGYNASYGLGNVIPFVTMPNGISKQYYLNRFDFTRAHIMDEERKSHLLEDISNNQYIAFLIHANLNEWTTVNGTDNKTTLDLLRETIIELKNTYGDQIEWRTASGAINSISDIPITKAGVEQMVGMMTREEMLAILNGGDI